MTRYILLTVLAAFALAACAPPPPVAVAPTDSQTAPKVYKIRSGSTSKLQFRMLDAVNALRDAQGITPVELNSQLNAAAATHSRDMSLQNRPWHFGSDGSSPIDRLARVGYPGSLVGENISETYETELETLGAWMEQTDTRRTILAPDAGEMGFAWFQEKNGKIWWTLVMGNPNLPAQIPASNPPATRLVPFGTDPPSNTGADENTEADENGEDTETATPTG